MSSFAWATLGDGNRNLSARFFTSVWWLSSPLIAISFTFRVLSLAMKALRLQHHDLFLALAALVCIPLGLFAEAVVATRYLEIRNGEMLSRSGIRDVLRAPGLASLLSRLALQCVLWIFVAMATAMLVYFMGMLPAIIVSAVTHPRSASTPHFSSGIFLSLFYAAYGFFMTRYALVIPFVALRGSARGLWREAVHSVNRVRNPLRVISTTQYLAVGLIAHSAYTMTHGAKALVWQLSFAAATAALSGAVTAYGESFKVEVAAGLQSSDAASTAHPATMTHIPR